MTEERLKEIKDSIDFQLSVCDIPEYETSKLLAEEELELYNEVVRLREIIDNAIEYYETFQEECVIGRNRDEKLVKDYFLPAHKTKQLYNILKQYNLTLEQLTGVENE